MNKLHHKPMKSEHRADIRCAYHLDPVLNPTHIAATVKKMVTVLRKRIKKGDDFDAIAVRGLSGTLIAPVLALKLKKTLLVVRKGEDCHSSQTVEGDYGARSYVIVDDFVSSGRTVRAITEELAAAIPAAVCVGFQGYSAADATDYTRGWRSVEDLRDDGCVILTGQEERAIDFIAMSQSYSLLCLAYLEAREKYPAYPICEDRL